MTDLAVEPVGIELEAHRRELTGYCYRMLGSSFDAEDAVQETMVRAWRGFGDFEGRSSLRSWLYRIATNVSLDMLNGRKRRALPMDLSDTSWQPVEASLGAQLPERSWVEPILDNRVLADHADPAEMTLARESIRLAFVAALQQLPPRQRAVLILRDVLRWKADEVAALLDSSVASVNSALQPARATMADDGMPAGEAPESLNEESAALLTRYVEAFERYDIDAFVSLLHEDATQSMPPYQMWLQGSTDIGRWMLGPGSGCRGSRLQPIEVNGAPGFAHYRRDAAGEGHSAFALQVLELSDGRVVGISSFLDADLFRLLGLPTYLAGSSAQR